MYKGYKVVVNTGAGRRRNLNLLIPQVLDCDIVDRYDLWINTVDKVDYNYLISLVDIDERINLISQPENFVNGVHSMNSFYLNCVDRNTIYIKMDDDLLYLSPDFIVKLVDERIRMKDAFLVTPLVVNNDLGTYLLQLDNILKLREYFPHKVYNKPWYNGYFATELHSWFLRKLEANEIVSIEDFQFAGIRFSINCVAWFGHDFESFGGKILGDDEEFLSVYYPSKSRRVNYLSGNVVCSHYSFGGQKRQIERNNVLEKYESFLLNSYFSDNQKDIHKALVEKTKRVELQVKGLEKVPYDSPNLAYMERLKRGITSKLRKFEKIDNVLSLRKELSIRRKLLKEESTKGYIVEKSNNLPRF